jgi:hypothetical protein
MTTLITAEEARKLSPEVNKWMAALSDQIRDAATAGGTNIRFPRALTEVQYGAEVVSKQGIGKIVAQRLVDAGFVLVSTQSYLTVEW